MPTLGSHSQYQPIRLSSKNPLDKHNRYPDIVGQLAEVCWHALPRSVTPLVTLYHPSATLCHALRHALSRSITPPSRSKTLHKHVFFVFLFSFFVFFHSKNLSRSVTLCHAGPAADMYYKFVVHSAYLRCLR